MFVKYHFANGPLPPPTGCLYDYVVAQNGVYIRASRPGLHAAVMTACIRPSIRGLDVIGPHLSLVEKAPAELLLRFMRLAYAARPRELLAYLRHNDGWYMAAPRQSATSASVHPIDPFDDAGREALIEIHSHADMSAFFSPADNHDESNGFRIYAVVGRISSARPQIAVRVGIYGHFWNIPADWVFDLPPFMSSQSAWIDARLAGQGVAGQGVAK